MKNVHIFFLVGILWATMPAHAQNQSGGTRTPQGQITGLVIEASTQDPMASATVSLWNTADSSLVTGTVTTLDGAFTLTQLRPGSYYVQVSFIGYLTETIAAVNLTPSAARVTLDDISLRPDTGLLDEIEVTAERSFMEVEVDRTVYNIKDQLVSVGGSASDVLENIPSVEVDMDGKISLRGNQNVAILINGRPSPVQGEALAGFLQSLSGETIERVEVMPNPSARYEPDGMAGILNIVLKKTNERHVNGGITSSVGTNDNYNLSGNVNFKQGKFNVFSNYGFRYGSRVSESDRYRENRYNDPLTFLDQAELSTRKSLSHTFNTSIDYTLSEKNTLSLSTLLSTRPREADAANTYAERDALQALLDRYDRLSDNTSHSFNTDHTLAFRRIVEPSRHEFTAELRFNTDFSEEESAFTEMGLLDETTPTQRALEGNQVDRQSYRGSFQVDYMRPMGTGGKLEAGVKNTLRRLDNAFYAETFDAARAAFLPNLSLNNTFIYEEQVHAAYGIYGQDFGDLDVQVGARVEQALTDFNLETTQEAFDNNYFSVFPSAFATYALSETRRVKASYSKRINRPRTRQLNPFSSLDDPLNRNVGNPYLKPEYIHAFEVGFTQFTERTSMALSPYFRRTMDVMQRWLTVDDQGVTTQSYANFDNSDSYGFEAIGTYQIRGRVNAFASFNAYRIMTDGSNVDTEASNNAMGWTTRLNTTFTVREGLDLQLSYFYRSPIDIAGGRIASFSSANVALRQKLFGGQGNLSVRMSDVFDTLGFDLYREDQNLYLETSRKWASRSAYVSFTYNFGKPNRNRNRSNEDRGDEGMGDIVF